MMMIILVSAGFLSMTLVISPVTTQGNIVLAGSTPVDYWAAFRLNLQFKNPDSNRGQGEATQMADREHQL